MRHQRIIFVIAVLWACTGGSPAVRAGEMWSVSHVSGGAGTAHLFDRGVVEHGGDAAIDERMEFAVTDMTRSGPLGAAYTSMGSSEVVTDEQQLRLNAHFRTAYDPSQSSEGDRPGGEGNGSTRSLIHFVMPDEVLEWSYSLEIDQRGDFDGDGGVSVSNTTQSTLLLRAWSVSVSDDTTLVANPGDVIRVGFQAYASGHDVGWFMEPGFYDAELSMTFTIPEPCSLAFLGLAASFMLGRRARCVLIRKKVAPCGG